MDETEVVARLRALAHEPIDPAVADAHLGAIDATMPSWGTRPRHLVAAAIAFAVLAAGLVTAVTRAPDDPKPVSSVESDHPGGGLSPTSPDE